MALSLAQQVSDIQRLQRSGKDERGNAIDEEIDKLVEEAEQKDEGTVCQQSNHQPIDGQPSQNDENDSNHQCDAERPVLIPPIKQMARQQSIVTISNLHITKNNLSVQQHKIVTPPEQLLFINLPVDLPEQAYALAQSLVKRKSPFHQSGPAMDELLVENNQTSKTTDGDDGDDINGSSNHRFVKVYVPVYNVQWDDDQVFGEYNSNRSRTASLI